MFVRTVHPYPSDIRPLTSLRFFAALAVVIFHFSILLPYGGVPVPLFVTKGYLAVDFFFILSGFILTHVYGEAAGQGALRHLDFYGRRLARIYPVHLATLGVALMPYIALLMGDAALALASSPDARYIVSNVLMTHGWGLVDNELGFNRPSWSISAEWFAYLLFPFLALMLARTGARWMLVLSVLFFWALYVFVDSWPDKGTVLFSGRSLTERTFDYGILRILPEFIMGMALYRFGRVWALPRARGRTVLACALLVLVLMMVRAPDYAVVPVFAALIYLAAEAARNNVRLAVLDHPKMEFLGEASYSLYMVHCLWLQGVFSMMVLFYESAPPPLLFYGCWLGLWPAVFFSSLWCYRRVEQPWRHKLWSAYSRFCLRR